MADSRPVGIFDSGLGGLTVLSAIHERMPAENLVYFGDTARVPYGSKSKDTIIRYSLEILEFLLQQNVKQVVVACNTASSYALDELQKKSPVPVIGVVEPGIRALLEASEKESIEKAAVIATRSTIRSGAYETGLKQKSNIFLYGKACPLFVPLVEEGFSKKNVTGQIIREYLDELDREQISHIILGCTHYPLLKDTIQRIYPHFNLIDSSIETARLLQEQLNAAELKAPADQKGEIKLFVSDITDSLLELEKLFLGKTIHQLEKVVLGW